MDSVGQGIGLGGKGFLISRDVEKAEGFRGADAGIAINEDAGAIGFLPDIDRLGGIEAVDRHVSLDCRKDLGLDDEERSEGLGLGDLVEGERDADSLVARVVYGGLVRTCGHRELGHGQNLPEERSAPQLAAREAMAEWRGALAVEAVIYSPVSIERRMRDVSGMVTGAMMSPKASRKRDSYWLRRVSGLSERAGL